MTASSSKRPAGRALLAVALLACAAPVPAHAHGGTTVATGQSGGVTLLVQGSDAATPTGKPAVDLATTLAGPGTGPQAKVVYYVRPAGGKSVRVEADRDASGVQHAEIATADRGNWRDWDVSALLTLSGGKKLRVTNAPSNPPGPDPTQAKKTAPANEPTTPASTPEAAAADEPADEPINQPVDDISGESDGAPSWAVPSLVILGVVALLGVAVARRRSRPSKR